MRWLKAARKFARGLYMLIKQLIHHLFDTQVELEKKKSKEGKE